MITGGIDVGIEYTKAVVLKDGKLIGKAKLCSGGAQRGEAAKAAWEAALESADVAADSVKRIVATGKGKLQVPFAHDIWTEPVVYARAARALNPKATMLANLGADETLVVTLKEDGGVKEICQNQKCAAGLGIFLTRMADRLEMSMEEMGQVDIGVSERVNDACVMFAELDALSLLNQGVCAEHVAAAATNAAAVRANTTLNDVTLPQKDVFLLTGAMALNKAFVSALTKLSGVAFIIPEEAEYAGALGAALFAQEKGE